jgi:hypothetical protein
MTAEPEPEQFVINVKDIQELVDIATDGRSKEFGKIIDWIGKVRNNPLNDITDRKAVLDELKRRVKECYVTANANARHDFQGTEAHGMGIAYGKCIELLGGKDISQDELLDALRDSCIMKKIGKESLL